MDDSRVHIGDVFKIGTATVQVTMPRQPCYKLGHRFRDQGIIAKFVAHENPGAYVRILENGEVKCGDTLQLIEKSPDDLKLVDFYRMCYQRQKDPEILNKAIANTALPEYKREELRKEQKKGA